MFGEKTKIAFLILLPWIWGLGGCVDSTDIKMGAANAQLVVEGKIEAERAPYILLSLSGSFYNEQPDFVDNAQVTISDDAGNIVELEHEGKGKYGTNSMIGAVGRKYHLEVRYQDKYYNAWTTLPPPPDIEQIDVEYFNRSVLREEGYYILIKGVDSNIKSGYYRILVYKDDKLVNPLGTDDLFVAISDEEDTVIKKIEVPIPFEVGDKLKVEVIKMDKAAYVFYQTYLLLLLNDGGLFGSPPSNPEGNISNGALGLFQAVSKLEMELEIEP